MATASKYDLVCVGSSARIFDDRTPAECCKVAAHNAANALALVRQATTSSAGSAVSAS